MRELILLIVVAVGAVLAFAWSTGVSSEPAEDEVIGPERVEAIARTCAACHGTGGQLQTEIPPLAGNPQAVLEAQLLAFKRDEVPGATVMPRLTRGYEDEELRAVAAYFASLERK